MDATVLGSVAATMTSDGATFGLYDAKNSRFTVGPATSCNMARVTGVALPPGVLVALLLGQVAIPASAHATNLRWDGNGYYSAEFRTNFGTEYVELSPHPADLALPWESQRMRVRSVALRLGESVLYAADFDEYGPADAAPAAIHDPDGVDADVQPSGPACTAEVPHRIHISMPGKKTDLRVRYKTFVWNPPIPGDTFLQRTPPGMSAVFARSCE
jgi:hypothetical protein